MHMFAFKIFACHQKKREPASNYLRRRFHLITQFTSDSDSVSNDLDLIDVFPAGANVDVHFMMIHMGKSCWMSADSYPGELLLGM
jgi:hypothetical protein